MTYFRYAFVLTALFALLACSDDAVEITEGSATGIYNDIKGTYEGVVPVGNESRPVPIVVANDEFTIKRLPLEPILKAVFTEQKELEEAVASSGETTTFTAPIVQMAVTSNTVALSMDPTDIVFTVTVGGERKQVSALMESVYLRRAAAIGGDERQGTLLRRALLQSDRQPRHLSHRRCQESSAVVRNKKPYFI